MREPLVTFIGTSLANILMVLGRGLIVMFLAAALHEQFDVWGPIGFLSSLPIAAGYGLLRGLFQRDEDAAYRTN